MLLMMIERKEKIAAIVFFDTGWEFSQMYAHIDLLERRIERKIWKIHSPLPFDYWLTSRPIVARKKPYKGQVRRIGNGWPSPSGRWCTRQKIDSLDLFCRPYPNPVQCIGYAFDESQRKVKNPKFNYRLPLKEWGVTEKGALQYCYDAGYDWGGLYDIFNRVSCYCCPLQRIAELRNLRKYFSDLWGRMLELEDKMEPKTNNGFKNYKTVHDFERKFAEEDKQRVFDFK